MFISLQTFSYFMFSVNLCLITIFQLPVGYVSLGATLKDEGRDAGIATTEANPKKCGERCDKISGCESFGFCREPPNSKLVNCYPKMKSVTGREPLKSPSKCSTYRKIRGTNS